MPTPYRKFLRQYGRHVFIGLAILIFLAIVRLEPPPGLTEAGKNSIGVFILCLLLWVSNTIPLVITSLLGIALLPLFNILSPSDTFSLFGNKALFFILGAFLISAALFKTGFGKRLARLLIVTIGHGRRIMIAGILLTSVLLSCIMPEHAVAALMFPMLIAITHQLKLQPQKTQYGKMLFLAMAWGCIIGGITTYLGGSRSLLAVSFLEKRYGLSLSFFEWIQFSWPIPATLTIIAYTALLVFFKIDIHSVATVREKLIREMKSAGTLSKSERKLMYILIATILAWIFGPMIIPGLGIAVTAIIGGVMLFIFGVVDWNDVSEYINWGVVIMYGGAIVVSSALTHTGATIWLSETLFSKFNVSPFGFIALITTITLFLTEGVSNVAAVAIVLPLAFAWGDTLYMNPIVTTLTVALAGGLAYMLPMGTPPNAIAFSSGFFSIRDSLRVGIIMNLFSWVVIVFVSWFIWPLMGIPITLR